MAANASPQKRRASGAHGAEPALKKQMVQDGKTVAKAVESWALGTTNLPEGFRHVLTEATPVCLSTFADQRHPYEATVVDMVGLTLDEVEAALQATVSEASAALDGLDRQKLQGQIVTQARKRAAAKVAEADKEAKLVEAMLKFRIADEALKGKIKVQKTADGDCDGAEAKKATIAEVMARLTAVKAAAASKHEINSLEKALKSFHVDVSLLSMLPQVLIKEPWARSEFDTVSLGSLDSMLARLLADVEAEILPMLPAKTERSNEVATAQAAFDAAKESRDVSKAALKDATRAVAAVEKELDAAESAEKDFGHTVKGAKAKKDDAEHELGKFRDGPRASFSRCKAQTTPPPPPPVEEPAAPAAEPAPAVSE